MGLINHEGTAFLDEISNHIAEILEDPKSSHFLIKDLVFQFSGLTHFLLAILLLTRPTQNDVLSMRF